MVDDTPLISAGVIYQDGKAIEQDTPGEYHGVKLQWVLGDRLYNTALVVLISFGKLSLPDDLYDFVEPLYIDGNKTNLSPANLLYRYNNWRRGVLH